MEKKSGVAEFIKKMIISGTNMITYLVLGLLIVFYCIQLYEGHGTPGVVFWAGTLAALLFVALVVGFCLSQMFPDRRSHQFAFLFNFIEFICIFIITLAGMELSEIAMNNVKTIDRWQIADLGRVLSLSREIISIQPAVPQALTYHPDLYSVVRLFSGIFRIAGYSSDVANYIVLIMHLLCAFFTYRIARMLTGRVASIVVYGLMMLIPSQICIVSVRNPQIYGETLVMIQLCVFLYSRRLSRMEKSIFIRLFLLTISAILAGLATFTLTPAFIVPFAEIYYVCALQRNRRGINPDSVPVRIAGSIILGLGSALVFAGLVALKCIDIMVSPAEIISGYLNSYRPNIFVPVNLPLVWGTDSYAEKVLYFHTAFENQISYGCMLGLAFICMLLCWYLQEKEFFVLRMLFLSIVVASLLNGKNTIEHLPAIGILAILAGGLFDKIYSTLRRKAFLAYQMNGYFPAGDVKGIGANAVAETTEKDSNEESGQPEDSVEELELDDESESADDDVVSEVSDENENVNFSDELQEANSESADDYEDTGVITIDDILSESARSVEEVESLGLDELENPLPVPVKKEVEAQDYDVDTDENDDYDYYVDE